MATEQTKHYKFILGRRISDRYRGIPLFQKKKVKKNSQSYSQSVFIIIFFHIDTKCLAYLTEVVSST